MILCAFGNSVTPSRTSICITLYTYSCPKVPALLFFLDRLAFDLEEIWDRNPPRHGRRRSLINVDRDSESAAVGPPLFLCCPPPFCDPADYVLTLLTF